MKFLFTRGLKSELISLAKVCSFFTLLLMTIRPFGLEPEMWKTILGYGIVAFSSGSIFLLTIHFFWKVDKWSVGNEIAKSIIFLILIAYSLLIYSNYSWGLVLSFSSMSQFIGITTLLGIVPISIRAISINNLELRRNLESAKQLNAVISKMKFLHDEKLIFIKSNVVDDTIETTNKRLHLVESAHNYIIVWQNEEDSISNKIMRMSLKQVRLSIDDPFILQCHRSFIVNLRFVQKAISNQNGLYLKMQQKNREIPVSRAFRKVILAKLKEIN